MRKLVIKTTLITFASIIFILGCLFLAFMIFSPKTIGDKAEKIGSYKIACWAYEKQYEKDKTKEAFDDLSFVYKDYVISLIDKEDYSSATDVTLSAIEKKYFDSSSVGLIKYELNKEKSKKNQTEQNKELISNCIEKIEQSINN